MQIDYITTAYAIFYTYMNAEIIFNLRRKVSSTHLSFSHLLGMNEFTLVNNNNTKG